MRNIREVIEKVFCYNHWTVAWRRVSKDGGAYPKSGDVLVYSVVPCEKGFWQADPFLVSENGKVYLFVEYMPFHSKHACIACREFSGDGFGKASVVLKEDVHLSYPEIFKQDGTYYMIPEMLNAHEVCLYRADEFPYKWSRIRSLFHMDSVDSTVFSDNRKVFLYDPDDRNDVLRKLYYASLSTENCEMPEPVKIRDFPEKLGRPAGNVFQLDSGKQIRPVQNCTRCYGGSLEFREFVLKEDVFEEKVVATLGPDDVKSNLKYKATGLHTWNRCGELEVIDLFYKRFSMLKPVRALIQTIRKKGAAHFDSKE